MSYYDDKYKCLPCNQRSDLMEGQMTNDYNYYEEEHLSATWHPSAARDNLSFHKTGTSNTNSGYYPGDYHSFQERYGNRDVDAMPELPAIGLARSLYFPPINEQPEAPNLIATKITANNSFQSTGSNEHSKAIYHKTRYFDRAPVITHMEGLSASGSSEGSTTSTTLNRPCDRPSPAKSAFMMFSEAKGCEIMSKAGNRGNEGVVKAVAREWRKLSRDDKKHWEQMAKQVRDKKLICLYG
jgi:hypothetical protein